MPTRRRYRKIGRAAISPTLLSGRHAIVWSIRGLTAASAGIGSDRDAAGVEDPGAS
jgi:hypothetical protein